MARFSILVDEWLTERQTTAKRRLSKGSAASYRGDLAIWAKTIAELRSRPELEPTDEEVGLSQQRGRNGTGVARLRVLRQDRELDRIDTSDLTEITARAALADMNRSSGAATQQRRLAALSGLCRWLVKKKVLAEDPIEELGATRTGGRLPVGFTEAEVERVFAVAASDRKGSSAWPARDSTIVRILAGTGIRNAELTGLYIGSFDRDSDPCLLRVRGKGEKTRVIPVPASVLPHVDAYLEERRDLGRGGHLSTDVLLVRRDGSSMDRFAVDRLLGTIFLLAGVSVVPGEKAHRFRHAYAQRMLAGGMTVNQVQALLGHESLQTTGIYTKLGATDLLDAARLAHGAEA